MKNYALMDENDRISFSSLCQFCKREKEIANVQILEDIWMCCECNSKLTQNLNKISEHSKKVKVGLARKKLRESKKNQ